MVFSFFRFIFYKLCICTRAETVLLRLLATQFIYIIRRKEREERCRNDNEETLEKMRENARISVPIHVILITEFSGVTIDAIKSVSCSRRQEYISVFLSTVRTEKKRRNREVCDRACIFFGSMYT